MAVRKIVFAPNPVLREICNPVQKIDARIQALLDDMLETMYASKGIGLAANQIAERDRVLVMDVSEDQQNNPQPTFMINPEIVWKSEEGRFHREGCLSLPELYAEVERPLAVRVRYLDREGKNREIETDGLLATCVQHEIDHLNGVLFVDYLSRLKRDMMMKKLEKNLANRAG